MSGRFEPALGITEAQCWALHLSLEPDVRWQVNDRACFWSRCPDCGVLVIATAGFYGSEGQGFSWPYPFDSWHRDGCPQISLWGKKQRTAAEEELVVALDEMRATMLAQPAPYECTPAIATAIERVQAAEHAVKAT